MGNKTNYDRYPTDRHDFQVLEARPGTSEVSGPWVLLLLPVLLRFFNLCCLESQGGSFIVFEIMSRLFETSHMRRMSC